MKISNKKNAFTIIELLVVMSVLALLVVFSSLFAANHLKKARDARRKVDLEKIAIVLNDYYSDQGCFPDSIPDCGQSLGPQNSSYLKNFPCDSLGNPYVYQTDETGCSQWFKILTKLEYTADSGIDKVGCRSGCGPGCQYNYGLSSTNIRLNQGCVTYYACGPSGECLAFEDPDRSQCPRVFENDPTCGGDNNSCSLKDNRCHDASGKQVPYFDGPTPTEEPKPTKQPK